MAATESLDHVDRFVRHAGPIDWDPAALASCHVADDVAAVLAVAALLEEDTAITARQARSLGLDRSADVAAFLPVWESEEAEHARALRHLTACHSVDRPPTRPVRNDARRRGQALVPVRAAGRFGPVGTAFCTLGAAAEYVAVVVYTELAKMDTDPEAVTLLRSISRQEGRHLAFLLAAAQQRAETLNAPERRLTRWLIRRLWTPVGMATLGPDRWWTAFGPLLERPGVRSRIARMDRVVDAVPHLSGLRLAGTFLDAHPSAAPTSASLTAATPQRG